MLLFLFLIIQTEKPNALGSKLPTATLIVSSSPSGMKVYINDVYQDTTPLTIKDLVVWRKYILRVERKGYKTYCDTIIFRTPITLEKDIIMQKEEPIEEEEPKRPLVQEICAKAKKDAKEDVEVLLWAGIAGAANTATMYVGLLLVVLGDAPALLLGLPIAFSGGCCTIGAANLYRPNPPLEREYAVSPVYLQQYRACYKEAAKRIRMKGAIIGGGASIAIFWGLLHVLFYP